jgi:dTDP-4-dehydrorhamnose reductase
MRILVIGASGCIGRRLCRDLGRRHHVTGTFRSVSQEVPGCRVTLRTDIRRQEEIDALFQQVQPEVIYHLAYDLQDLEGSIIQGTLNALRARQNLSVQTRFIFLSTGSVFDGESGPFSESDIPRPITPYGQAKRRAELDVLAAGGLVVRTALVYGLGPPDPITRVLLQGLQSGSFHYPYFEDEIRCPIWVDDLSQALAECLWLPVAVKILHFAGPQPMSRYDLARKLAEKLGYDPDRVPRARLAESPLTRPRDLTLDTSLARQLLPLTWRDYFT